MKPGDFVEVDYIGRIKESGEIFDLTKEDVAKEENVFNPNTKYGPVVFIVGADFLMKGMSEALQGMKVGEKKSVVVTPERAFGQKNMELVKMIPLARFKEQNMDPAPGAIIDVGAMKGTIVSVSGGRVKVDFNHPLAGKTLEYDLEIKSQITDVDRKIKSVAKYFTGLDDDEVGVKFEKKIAEIEIKKKVGVARQVKVMIAKAVVEWCGAETVRFVDVFEKSEFEDAARLKKPEEIENEK
jgi:FKBP-type peptidyl-prolyl cis-trans isomerase 2